MSLHYDLVVIGSGPAGQKAAIAASKIGKQVAVVDRRQMMGGVCVNTGTIPSKTLREAILYLSGFRQRTFYGRDYTVKEDITVRDLAQRVAATVDREVRVIRHQLKRNDIKLYEWAGRFTGPHSLEVEQPNDVIPITFDHALIACGTRPAVNPDIPIDGLRIVNSDQVLSIPTIPKSVIVVGAGVIGLEYASMIAALDVEVTIIDARPELLNFVDREIIDALCYHMRRNGASFRLGEKVESVTIDERDRVVAKLESGKRVIGEGLLYTVGRMGNADGLRLENVGVSYDSRGRIAVNEHFQTEVPHIYAAGDVIGFPALASASMEQGRLAACHMFGKAANSAPELYPYGIYTLPEISMVGRTEQELTAARVSYEFGIAKFEELAKGQMVGDETGMLKLLFCPETRKLLGVHVIGESAAEIVHIGQVVLSIEGSIDYFRDTVFNYPTLAEAYKVAALDGLNKL